MEGNVFFPCLTDFTTPKRIGYLKYNFQSKEQLERGFVHNVSVNTKRDLFKPSINLNKADDEFYRVSHS